MDGDGVSALAQAWDEAADGYERYFVPRFAPWVAKAVKALTEAPLPGEGPVLVPCCGTFPELPALLAAEPGREIIGIDLSPGMVARAKERAKADPLARVEIGDVAVLDRRWADECAGVVSVFGLQQLPDPLAALASWTAALRPGGRLSVMFWPGVVETDGPFAWLGRVLAVHRPSTPRDWEARLHKAIEEAGAVIERDEEVAFPMSHPGAGAFWTAMAAGGPLRAFANSCGEEVMRLIEREFLTVAPEGPLHHRPSGRLIVASRRSCPKSGGR